MNYPPGTPDLMTALADDGYSDFASDYTPTDEQLIEWLTDRPEEAIETIRTYSNGGGILDSAWQEKNEETIEKEWDNK